MNKMNSIEYIIKEKCDLITFLTNTVKNKSKNNIKSLISNSCISVNDVVVNKYNQILNINDKISIILKQIRSKTNINIIYEDDYIIVVDKPFGIPTISTEKEKNITLYKIVMQYLKTKNKNNKIFIVHRLDKDTSGVIIFAKSERIKNLLQNNWEKIVKNREYIAICEGCLEIKKDTIKTKLVEEKNYFVHSSIKEGKLAITHYKVLKENNNYSMLKVNIDTGRKNQIRVHLSELGYPIIGDKKYKSSKNPIKRLGLHANKISLIYPITNKLVEFISPIPISFTDIL